jgi:hypothetical protein
MVLNKLGHIKMGATNVLTDPNVKYCLSHGNQPEPRNWQQQNMSCRHWVEKVYKLYIYDTGTIGQGSQVSWCKPAIDACSTTHVLRPIQFLRQRYTVCTSLVLSGITCLIFVCACQAMSPPHLRLPPGKSQHCEFLCLPKPPERLE